MTSSPAETTAQRRGRNREWHSGWCGPGPCNDGKIVDGVPVYRCKGVGQNGANVSPRYVYCACSCHVENPAAAHPVHIDESPTSLPRTEDGPARAEVGGDEPSEEQAA